MDFFTSKYKNETFAANSNFFFSPILDVQDKIVFGEKAQLKSKVEDEDKMDVDQVEEDFSDFEEA